MKLAARDLASEIRKHFQGTPEERILQAMRLGQQALDIFQATLAPGTSRAAAREIMQRNKRHGRRPSVLMETRRG
jgi:hypothetical protein